MSNQKKNYYKGEVVIFENDLNPYALALDKVRSLIKKRIEELQLNPADVAVACNVDPVTFGRFLDGSNKKLNPNSIQTLLYNLGYRSFFKIVLKEDAKIPKEFFENHPYDPNFVDARLITSYNYVSPEITLKRGDICIFSQASFKDGQWFKDDMIVQVVRITKKQTIQVLVQSGDKAGTTYYVLQDSLEKIGHEKISIAKL